MNIFKPVCGKLSRFLGEDGGSTMIEYALIIGLIFLAIAGALKNYASETGSFYSELASTMQAAGE